MSLARCASSNGLTQTRDRAPVATCRALPHLLARVNLVANMPREGRGEEGE